MDSILVINELTDYGHRHKKSIFMFKVNFEKAFNSIAWDCVFFMLMKINFGSKWTKWIQGYICSGLCQLW